MNNGANKLLLIKPELGLEDAVERSARHLDLEMVIYQRAHQALEEINDQETLAVLLDTSQIGDNVSELIYKIKRKFPDLAIIAVLETGQKEKLVSLLKAGAWTCMELPIVSEELNYYLNKITSERSEVYDPFSARFDERTVVIPNNFSLVMPVSRNLVYNSLPAEEKDRYRIVLGLSEIVNNAIEHGNLEISSQEKSAALKSYTFFKLASERAAREPYRSRVVTLKAKIFPLAQKVEYSITDEGNGFNWKVLPNPRHKVNILKGSGRGITIAQIVFHDVIFNKKGNQVTLVYKTKE